MYRDRGGIPGCVLVMEMGLLGMRTYCAGETGCIGLVVCFHRVHVEEFAGVVGVISRGLEPNGEVGFIEALGNKLWVAT